MAGETIRTEAVCLDIRPWSRTSHIVTWLTPVGKVATVVKGAVRPKSAFLGQYDLNYTCDILYYARAKGELHALRDCVPLDLRESLRGNYRALALAGYFRQLVSELAPSGPDCRPWYELLSSSLAPHPSNFKPQTSSPPHHLFSLSFACWSWQVSNRTSPAMIGRRTGRRFRLKREPFRTRRDAVFGCPAKWLSGCRDLSALQKIRRSPLTRHG